VLHVRLDAIGQRVALAPGEQRRKVLHDLGVGVEDRERRAVLRSPVPQQEPVRLELVHGGQVTSPGTRRALRQKVTSGVLFRLDCDRAEDSAFDGGREPIS